MKRRMFSVVMATMSVAMFVILYPEYILLPDTYDYITNNTPKKICRICSGEYEGTELEDLLYEKPENVQISSKLLQMLEKEGIIKWKDRN